MQATVPQWIRNRDGICDPAPPSPKLKAQTGDSRAPEARLLTESQRSRVLSDASCRLESEHAVMGPESTLTY